MTDTDTIPKASDLEKRILDTILKSQLPKARWSCSDDVSGTALTLARQVRFIADAVRGILEEEHSKPKEKPQIPPYPTAFGDAMWLRMDDDDIPMGTQVDILGLALDTENIYESTYWIRGKFPKEKKFTYRVCLASDLNFEKEA